MFFFCVLKYSYQYDGEVFSLDKMINLSNHLFYDEVRNQIALKTKESLKLSADLLSYVEEELLLMLNDAIADDNDNKLVNEALFLFFAQGIKSVKSSLILSTEGYLTNAVMCARNCIETIFNIHYLVGDKKQSESRAKKFLSNPTYWTSHKIIERAYMELNRPLYELYRIFSNYTHSNLMGVSQNILANHNISSIPSAEKIPYLINMTNALFYSMILDISDHYQIKSQRFDSIKLNEETQNMLETFDIERTAWDDVTNMFKEMGFTEAQIQELQRDYKKHSLKNLKNKNPKKNKSKNKRKKKKR